MSDSCNLVRSVEAKKGDYKKKEKKKRGLKKQKRKKRTGAKEEKEKKRKKAGVYVSKGTQHGSARARE